MRTLVGVAVLTLLASPVLGQKKDDWKTFEWKEGKCSVLLPGKPIEQKAKAGNFDQFNQVVPIGDKQAYLVSYMDIPPLKAADEATKYKAMENGMEAANRNFKGKIISKEKIKLDGHPGLEYQIEVPNMGIFRARNYVVGERLYQIVVMAPADIAKSKASDDYLRSFKLK